MNLPMKGQWRFRFARIGGVKLKGNKYFIGKNVVFDTVYPENITIGNNVHITSNVTLLTHILDTEKLGVYWKEGHISIGDNCFIGTGTIICQSVHIGNDVIIGAGSVVTKDIPDGQIWAGNPAKFIKSRY